MSFRLLLVLLISLLTLISCRKKPLDYKNNDTDKQIEQVKNRVNSFLVADTTLNSDKVVKLLWPEFEILNDGNYSSYEEVKKGSKIFMESLKIFHSEWIDIKIIPIGKNHTISSFNFIDSIVTKNGIITKSKGSNTFIWEKRKDEWKVIFADANHYPIE